LVPSAFPYMAKFVVHLLFFVGVDLQILPVQSFR
jgi:hypothetical protein